ncbi:MULTISPECIES: hypothetical protein [unclassified Mycobacterium]|uniref:channel accessory protein ArfC, sunset domain variant n=1 Tax=unclassified Mycobacterium TaxID=2642494 RepID=UPI0029C8019B|nr:MULTISPECIES: hypothetical protein [unclassified Mycobacterium]
MHNVNCWLLALAFLLGLVITLAFLLRRVKREVPEYGSGGGSARLTGPSAGLKAPKVDLPDVDAPTAKVPKISSGGAVAAGAAGAVGGAAAAKLTGSGGDVDTPTAKVPKVDVPDVDAPTAVVPKVDAPKISGAGAVAAGAAGVAAGAGAAKLVGSGSDSGKDSEPYGAGSLRLAGGAAAPSGWTIKGNEDSMLYHTTESPSYKQTIAEVWFRDEPTAERAGFTRWDKGRSSGGGGGIAALADVPAGKHGPGSATPGAGGSGPQGWTIKGNEDSMLYHTTESPSYKRTIAEVWFFDEDTARKAGFTHWKEGRKTTGAAQFAAIEPEVPPGPHGPGSATPGPGGSGPAGWSVKGNEDSMLYHSTESPAFDVTVAEVWFRDVATAEAAGFNRWDSGKSQRGKH